MQCKHHATFAAVRQKTGYSFFSRVLCAMHTWGHTGLSTNCVSFSVSQTRHETVVTSLPAGSESVYPVRIREPAVPEGNALLPKQTQLGSQRPAASFSLEPARTHVLSYHAMTWHAGRKRIASQRLAHGTRRAAPDPLRKTLVCRHPPQRHPEQRRKDASAKRRDAGHIDTWLCSLNHDKVNPGLSARPTRDINLHPSSPAAPRGQAGPAPPSDPPRHPSSQTGYAAGTQDGTSA